VALVRGPGSSPDGELAQYVNDRPYAASSMLAVALNQVFRTALTGRCHARPDLAAQRIPLEIRVQALRCRGGAGLAQTVFVPLGWDVDASAQPLQPREWGDSAYVDLRLTGELRLADALNHLDVLPPVLDDAKHYWVSTDEVDKLVRAGGDWLAGHPAKELIARRYLSHQRKLTRSALTRLAEADDTEPAELDNAVTGPDHEEDQTKPLAIQRREAILAVLREKGARRSVIRAARLAGSASSACTGRRPARPTSTACRCGIPGRRSTGAGPRCSTVTPRCPRPNGLTTPCAWIRAVSSVAV
jgi:3' terminal RNA ribose 2'-O-methyltransferase Hen1